MSSHPLYHLWLSENGQDHSLGYHHMAAGSGDREWLRLLRKHAQGRQVDRLHYGQDDHTVSAYDEVDVEPFLVACRVFPVE